jgi:hypothetical protein
MLTFRQVLPENFEIMALQTFFSLMMNGWVTNNQIHRRTIYGKGMQSNYHIWGNKQGWHAADEWRTSEMLGHYSSGETTIWFKECLVWHMQYSGWYQQGAVPLLKTALNQNYSTNTWHGGRGPMEWELDHSSLIYINQTGHITGKTDFSRFEGIEMIGEKGRNNALTTIGVHRYHGGFMF